MLGRMPPLRLPAETFLGIEQQRAAAAIRRRQRRRRAETSAEIDGVSAAKQSGFC
jgi:hypothetical protein